MAQTHLEGRRIVREVRDEHLGALVHPEWIVSFGWAVQGTTTREVAGEAFDLGLFSDGSPRSDVHGRWRRLIESAGMRGAVHAPQVHEAEVRIHDHTPTGLHLTDACDGHLTDRPGALLAVATADCVPVFVVEPRARVVGVLHAGWRGAACGVLERGVRLLLERSGGDARDVYIHFGPSICGTCYQVGPEVFEALAQERPAAPEPIDLRAVMAQRALALGADPVKVTVSGHCTRCTGSSLFSHRGGDRGRQVGFVGIRA